jgi:probable rRNA maturation factor
VKHSKNIVLNKESNTFKAANWKLTKDWLYDVIEKEGKELGFLNYSLISDESLLKINKDSLNHDYYTDIITFDLSDIEGIIEGDIYISYDRIKENAKVFHVKRMRELRRVFVHGLLHLLGYRDKTKKQKKVIREKEDLYLDVFYSSFKKKKK